jgi:hypothetical protein
MDPGDFQTHALLAKEGRTLWLKALATLSECLVLKAIVAKNQQKTKSQIQEQISLFTKSTKQNFKDHCYGPLHEFLTEKLNSNARPSAATEKAAD